MSHHHTTPCKKVYCLSISHEFMMITITPRTTGWDRSIWAYFGGRDPAGTPYQGLCKAESWGHLRAWPTRCSC